MNGTNQGNGIDLVKVTNLRIGGTNAAERNIISGNRGYGIYLSGDVNSLIQGNYIGTDKHGSNVIAYINATNINPLNVLGNGFHGILTDFGSTNCTIGGSTPGARNVISGNGTRSGIDFYEGIELRSINSRVQGNYIGLDATGTRLIGNYGQGVAVDFGNNNTIGGTIAGEGNVIAGNGEDGVFVIGEILLVVPPQTNGVGNAILGNSIYGNGVNISLTNQIGIDLYGGPNPPYGAGVSPNDACDVDVDGGNRFQNFPVLTNSVSDLSSITISGYLDGMANSTNLLEFFANPFGTNYEGKTFLGRAILNTGNSCLTNFSVTFSKTLVLGGQPITATASRSLGGGFYETSEFSQCITNNGPILMTTPSAISPGGSFCIDWIARGGSTNYVQRALSPTNAFVNIIPPGPWVATNYCDQGAAANNPANSYRILYTY